MVSMIWAVSMSPTISLISEIEMGFGDAKRKNSMIADFEISIMNEKNSSPVTVSCYVKIMRTIFLGQ